MFKVSMVNSDITILFTLCWNSGFTLCHLLQGSGPIILCCIQK